MSVLMFWCVWQSNLKILFSVNVDGPLLKMYSKINGYNSCRTLTYTRYPVEISPTGLKFANISYYYSYWSYQTKSGCSSKTLVCVESSKSAFCCLWLQLSICKRENVLFFLSKVTITKESCFIRYCCIVTIHYVYPLSGKLSNYTSVLGGPMTLRFACCTVKLINFFELYFFLFLSGHFKILQCLL